MFEFFIAKKYLRSKHKVNFITIISLLSTLGIMIGVAALIIVISVFNGFGAIATSMLLNFDPHIKVTLNSQEAIRNQDSVQSILNSIDEVKGYYPYLESKVILMARNNYKIINLKGITPHDSDEDWGVEKSLISGSLNLSGKSGIDEIALSTRMAIRLSVRIGDTIQVSSFRNIERMAANFTVIPTTKNIVVSGVFESNNTDYDLYYSFTSLRSAQQLLGLNTISGYEINLYNIDESEKVKNILETKLNPVDFSVYTWYDLHREFYNIMQIERWGAFILMLLIISVATFNILGSLTMSVIEKKKDIGVLRSMGANRKSILRIFMFEGILVGTIGTILGFIVGLLVCYLQTEFRIYTLDPSKYIIDAIPIKIQLSDLILIPIASMFLTFVASLYPAKRAVKINVIDSIKYE